jgi:Universal stress protein family
MWAACASRPSHVDHPHVPVSWQHAPVAEPPPMYDPILVALDGSRRSEHVLPYMAAMAASTGNRVILLRAIDPPSTAFSSPADSLRFANLEQRHASNYLARVRAPLQKSRHSSHDGGIRGNSRRDHRWARRRCRRWADCDQYAWTGRAGSLALRQRCHGRDTHCRAACFRHTPNVQEHRRTAPAAADSRARGRWRHHRRGPFRPRRGCRAPLRRSTHTAADQRARRRPTRWLRSRPASS